MRRTRRCAADASGIGAFLIISGLQVTARLDEVDNEGPISDVLRSMMASAILPLWLVPIGLAIAIRTLTHYVHNPLVFPLFFVRRVSVMPR